MDCGFDSCYLGLGLVNIINCGFWISIGGFVLCGEVVLVLVLVFYTTFTLKRDDETTFFSNTKEVLSE